MLGAPGHVVTGATAGLASNRLWFACRHGRAHPRPGDFTRCRWQHWSGCIFRRRAGRGAAPGNGNCTQGLGSTRWRTKPINARRYSRQSITAGSDHTRKSRVSYPTEKRTPVQQSLIRTTIAETQLSTAWRPFEEKRRESSTRSVTAVAVAGKSIRRPIATPRPRVHRFGRKPLFSERCK